MATWARATERQDFDYNQMKEKVLISGRAQHMLQQAFRDFKHTQAVIFGANACSPIKKTASQIKHCPMCEVGKDGCEGNPTGAAAGMYDGTNDNWCKFNCKIEGKPEDETEKETEVKQNVRRELNKLNRELMQDKLEQVCVCRTLSLSLSLSLRENHNSMSHACTMRRLFD